MKQYDILIIGGGISGLTAAIYAARANHSVCVLEREVCGGLVNYTNLVENIPSYRAVHGMEFMEKCRAHADALNVAIEELAEVTDLDVSGTRKLVKTASGEEYAASALIIATGRTPRKFPVQTDFPNIHYCSVCDGAPYAGKELVIVGGGNSGFDESLYLLGLGVRSIHIVEALPQCLAAASTQDAARATGKIRVTVSADIVAVETRPDGRGLVRIHDKLSGTEHTEETDAIFCFIGQTPNSAIFAGHVAMQDGYITVNSRMETSAQGVFAAGDVTAKTYRQITTAMGDGTVAALQASAWLRSGGGAAHP